MKRHVPHWRSRPLLLPLIQQAPPRKVLLTNYLSQSYSITLWSTKTCSTHYETQNHNISNVRPLLRESIRQRLRSIATFNKYAFYCYLYTTLLGAGPVSRRNYSNKKLKPVQIKDNMLKELK